MTRQPLAAQKSPMTDQTTGEQPIDPQRPIIDPHLHLWDIPLAPIAMNRFLLPEVLATIDGSGHNITHTVFMECHAMYRQDGPPGFMPVGETEFANGIAAMSASGSYGPRRIAHRIVGHANLLLGAAVAPVLEAHRARGGERFRGIRFMTGYSTAGMFGGPCDPALRGLMLDARFCEGARVVANMDLILDTWCFHSQLDELIDLAGRLPDLTIVLDHLGTPESLGAYASRETETRLEWANKLAELACRPNVFVKVGGLGMDMSKPFGSPGAGLPATTLAARWRPYVETCIEIFSPRRCMFESNFPPDYTAGSYGAVWNAFKILTRDYAEAEKDQLFRQTAATVYRIDTAPAGSA